MERKERKVLMVDVESNGLYGEGFAFGVVAGIIKDGEVEVVEKVGYNAADAIEDMDPWVVENVLPKLNSLKKVNGLRELRDAFWNIYTKYKAEGYEIWGDVIYPVETGFMADVIKDDLENRQWEGPYPFRDLGTILDPNISRAEFSGMDYTHNPMDDALASLYSLVKVLKEQS